MAFKILVEAVIFDYDGTLVNKHERGCVVSDWSWDLKVAKELGFIMIGVLTGLCSGEELKEARADLVLTNISAMLGLIEP